MSTKSTDKPGNELIVARTAAIRRTITTVAIEKAKAQLKAVFGLVVSNEETRIRMTDMIATARRDFEALEERRAELVGPLNEATAFVNGQFKQVTKHLEEAAKEGRSKLSEWTRREARRVDEENARRQRESEEQQRKADEAAKNRQERTGVATQSVYVPPPALERAPDTTVMSARGTQSTARKFWNFQVKDHALVPRAYCVIDEKLIRQAVRDGIRDIPGVEIFEDYQTAVKGGAA